MRKKSTLQTVTIKDGVPYTKSITELVNDTALPLLHYLRRYSSGSSVVALAVQRQSAQLQILAYHT